MSVPAARRYLWRAGAIGLAAGLGPLALATTLGGAWTTWGPAGWLAAVAIGLAAGGALARVHGSPGWGFVVAMLAGMLARFVALAAGGVAAALSGREPLVAFVVGFGAGFVPLQVHEAIFLRRESRGSADGAGGRRHSVAPESPGLGGKVIG